MSLLSELRAFLHREQQFAAQRRELAAVHEELVKQRLKNERMREGMRRCLACDYRREATGRDQGPDGG